MTVWTDYIKNFKNQTYSQRVTGSGHITVSAKINQDGTLEAFPPRGASKAFPVFIKLDATSGGRITESLEGKYPQKEWELSSTVHKGRGELWAIFMDLYKEIHLASTPIVEEEKSSAEEKASALFSEGWRFWENDREVVFNNQTIGGTSFSVRGEKFVNEIFDLIGEKIENIQDVLNILGEKTEEAGY